MAETPPSPDWSLIESFLAVAEAGSLSGAARRLGRSQPTLGRQVQELEAALGARLFERHARGLALSDTGRDLLPMAERMRAEMLALTLAAAGRERRLAGTVRITASKVLSQFLLPDLFARIRAALPGVDLVLIASDRPENLLFREADIALRMFRPGEPALIARRAATLRIGIFAARSYLERAGRPARGEDLLRHDLIGYETSDLIVEGMRASGLDVTRDSFAVRCDDQAAYWALLRAGCGIGFGQVAVGRAEPLVEELSFGLDMPTLDVWLTAHEAMRRTPRVARVWEMLAEGLTRHH